MVGGFVAMTLDPAGADGWSFHVLGSLLALTLLIPLAVFLRPAPLPADAQEAAVAAVQDFQKHATHSASTRPTRPIWSYMEDAEAAQGDGAGPPSQASWPWADEPDLAANNPSAVPTIAPPHRAAPSAAPPDTNWEMSIWPFDTSDDWFSKETSRDAASSAGDADDDRWPPSNGSAFGSSPSE